MPTRAGTETWHYSGLAAYDVLANALLDDAGFPDDVPALSAAIERVMYNGIWMLLEEREAAAAFVQELACGDVPGTEILGRAAWFYAEEAIILRSATQFITMEGSEKSLVIAESSVRRELNRIVLERKPSWAAVSILSVSVRFQALFLHHLSR